MCVLFYSSFVCISAYANVYFKTIIIKQKIRIILIAGVPSSQALPGFLITAPPSVCVPEVIGVLAVWISNPNNNNNNNPNVNNKQWNISRKIPINTSKYKINYCPGCVMFIYVDGCMFCSISLCLSTCVCAGVCSSCIFVVSWCVFCSTSLLFWLHIYVFAVKSMVHCGSAFEPGASGLPYYCTPPLTVADVIGARAVWRQNNQKKSTCRRLYWSQNYLDHLSTIDDWP